MDLNITAENLVFAVGVALGGISAVLFTTLFFIVLNNRFAKKHLTQSSKNVEEMLKHVQRIPRNVPYGNVPTAEKSAVLRNTEELWYSADGPIKISGMTDQHLINTINFLVRKKLNNKSLDALLREAEYRKLKLRK
jgi:hypothetical protein